MKESALVAEAQRVADSIAYSLSALDEPRGMELCEIIAGRLEASDSHTVRACLRQIRQTLNVTTAGAG